MNRTTIVIGPRTRVGQALVRRAVARGDDVLVVARHDADAAALAGDGVTVLRTDQDVDLLAEGSGSMCVAVCALGPIHPDQARAADDSAAFLRELGFVERLLDAISGRAVVVVLVSSVIALAPGEDRRYYGGWKCLVEQQLAQSIRRVAPRAAFGVVYPGRLGRGRVPGLHASHARVADTVDALADGRSRSRLVGLDARLWMAVSGLKLLIGSVLPRRVPARDGSLEPSVSPNERSTPTC